MESGVHRAIFGEHSSKFDNVINFSNNLVLFLNIKETQKPEKNRDIDDKSQEARPFILSSIIHHKGQIISECLFSFFKFSKKPPKNLTNFCPRI